MKVALLLPGFVRGDDFYKIYKDFLKLNSNHEIFLFIEGYNTKGWKTPYKESKKTKNEKIDVKWFYENYDPTNINLYDVHEVSESIDSMVCHDVNPLIENKVLDSSDNLCNRTFAQFFMIRKAYNAAMDWASEKNLMYDLMIRGRFDVDWSIFDISKEFESKDKRSPLYIFYRGVYAINRGPSELMKLDYYNDSFAFGTPEGIEHFCRLGEVDFFVKVSKIVAELFLDSKNKNSSSTCRACHTNFVGETLLSVALNLLNTQVEHYHTHYKLQRTTFAAWKQERPGKPGYEHISLQKKPTSLYKKQKDEIPAYKYYIFIVILLLIIIILLLFIKLKYKKNANSKRRVK